MDLKNKTFDYDLGYIQARVLAAIDRPIKTLKDLEKYFQIWWCHHYNKPYKCVELESYTLEELAWEFFDVLYRTHPEARKKFEDKNIERTTEDEDWIKQMSGEGYLSPEEQEEALQEARQELNELPEFMDNDGFSENFDE